MCVCEWIGRCVCVDMSVCVCVCSCECTVSVCVVSVSLSELVSPTAVFQWVTSLTIHVLI